MQQWPGRVAPLPNCPDRAYSDGRPASSTETVPTVQCRPIPPTFRIRSPPAKRRNSAWAEQTVDSAPESDAAAHCWPCHGRCRCRPLDQRLWYRLSRASLIRADADADDVTAANCADVHADGADDADADDADADDDADDVAGPCCCGADDAHVVAALPALLMVRVRLAMRPVLIPPTLSVPTEAAATAAAAAAAAAQAANAFHCC